MAMSLPLAPPELIQDGITLVANHLQLFAGNAAVDRFIQYWHRQWGLINISVYGLQSRTNNSVESYHALLLTLVGRRHPNFWVFISYLQKMENCKAVDLVRVRRDPTELPLNRRAQYVRLDTRISKF